MQTLTKAVERVSADRKAVGQIDLMWSICHSPQLSVSADRKAVGQIDSTTACGGSRRGSRCQPIGKPLARSTVSGPQSKSWARWCQPIGKPLARSTTPWMYEHGKTARVSRSESRWPDRPRHHPPHDPTSDRVSRSESRWPDRQKPRGGKELAEMGVSRSESRWPDRRPDIDDPLRGRTRVSRSESRWPDRPTARERA